MATNTYTQGELKNWFSGQYRHKDYATCVELAARIAVHADGLYPDELIENRRPNEPENIKEYRREIWKEITKPYFTKVLNSLNKIRRSSEWMVQFDEQAVPARVVDGERPEQYFNTDFPTFGSITNWAFGLLLREWSIDANEWIGVKPIQKPQSSAEYVKPYPFIYKSEQIVEAIAGYVLVVLSTDKAVYKLKNGVEAYGDKYIIYGTHDIQVWDQTSVDRKFKMVEQYVHDIGIMPAFQVPAQVIKSNDGSIINESRLNGMMPRFDEAAREYSDLQAEVVQHIYNERWEMSAGDCLSCKGTGEIIEPGLRKIRRKCHSCNGSGERARGPFAVFKVPKQQPGENSKIPPMGLLEKNTQIVELQDKRFANHIHEGLAAINMEFLFQAPLSESGIAKAYDADETNNFVHAIAEDIVAIMDEVAYFINEMRYRVIVADPKQRAMMLPKIAVPERFDIFSAQVIEQELIDAKKNGINPFIVNAMEIEYANKRLSSNPEVADKVAITLKLDPLPNISEEDKVLKLQNGGISKATYIMSCNIYEFVNRAIEEKGPDSFYAMAFKDQQALLLGYAQEQAMANTAAAQVMQDNIVSISEETAP